MKSSNPDEINISDDEDDGNSTNEISTPANTSTSAGRRYPWLHDNLSGDELDLPSPNSNGRIVKKTVVPDNGLSFTEVQKSLEFVESDTRPSVGSCDKSHDKSCDVLSDVRCSQSVVTNPEEICIDEDDEGSLDGEGKVERETGEGEREGEGGGEGEEGERGGGGGERGEGEGWRKDSELGTVTEPGERNPKPLVIKRRNLTIYQSHDDV